MRQGLAQCNGGSVKALVPTPRELRDEMVTGSSRENNPRSISIITAVAVNGLVIEATDHNVCESTHEALSPTAAEVPLGNKLAMTSYYSRSGWEHATATPSRPKARIRDRAAAHRRPGLPLRTSGHR